MHRKNILKLTLVRFKKGRRKLLRNYILNILYMKFKILICNSVTAYLFSQNFVCFYLVLLFFGFKSILKYVFGVKILKSLFPVIIKSKLIHL